MNLSIPNLVKAFEILKSQDYKFEELIVDVSDLQEGGFDLNFRNTHSNRLIAWIEVRELRTATRMFIIASSAEITL